MTDPLLALAAPVFTVDGELVAGARPRLRAARGRRGRRGPADAARRTSSRSGPARPARRAGCSTSTAATSTSASGSRSPSGPDGASGPSSTGPSRRSRSVLRRRRAAARRGARRGRADAAADDPPDAHLHATSTDADIAAQIADEHGLQAEVAVDGPRYDVVQQVNQSDLAFLRERARLIQAELWCDGRTLHFSDRAAPAGAPRLTLVQGNDLLSVAALRRPRPPAHRGRGDRLRRGGRRRVDRRARRRRDDRGRGVPAGAPGREVARARRSGRARRFRVREVAADRRGGAGLGRRPRCCAGRARFVTVTGDHARHARHGRRQPAATARTVGRAVRGRRLLRHPGAPHLRPRARPAHPVRGRARHRERGGVMGLPRPRPTAARPATSASTRRSSPTSSTPTAWAGSRCASRALGHRRRPRRARLGDAVHALRRRRPGPGDPARGRQPGGGRLRGRRPAPALRRRARLERQARACPQPPEAANNIRLLRIAGGQPARVRRHRAAPKVTRRAPAAGHKVVLDDGAPGGHHPARERVHRSRSPPPAASRSTPTSSVDVTAPTVNVNAPDLDLQRHRQVPDADRRRVRDARRRTRPGVGNLW